MLFQAKQKILTSIYEGAIAVGLPVTQQAPHRSRRAELPHRALQEYSLPAAAYAAEGMALRGLPSIRGRSIWKSSINFLKPFQL